LLLFRRTPSYSADTMKTTLKLNPRNAAANRPVR
jgi:hypothetical protein